MYTIGDLEYFCSVLSKERSTEKDICIILKKLNDWNPTKSQVDNSGISKCILPLTKMSGQRGIKSILLLKKWHNLFNKTENNNKTSFDVSNTNCISSKADKNCELIYSTQDLLRFSLALENKDSPDKYISSVLIKLNNWKPNKSEIISSGIGKSIYSLTKRSGSIGSMSIEIVNKWKTLFLTDNHSTKFIVKGSDDNNLLKTRFPNEKSTYSMEELERFCFILNSEETPEKYIYKALLRLKIWVPDKTQIIDSGIGKCLSRLRNLSGGIGTVAGDLIKKWKECIDQRSNNGTVVDNRFSTNIVKKRKNENIIEEKSSKRKCLSLQDYYKRKPENCPDRVTESQTDKRACNKLTSDSGISFLDCITVTATAPRKSRPSGPLKISEINAGLLNFSHSRRSDVVVVDRDVGAETKLEDLEDLFKPIPCQPKVYNSKTRHPVAVVESTEAYFPGTITTAPSLLQQCQAVLLKYKTHIEEVLWTPRELLVDVLNAYNAEQLFHFETFNPHFIDDNEDLWQKHYMARNFVHSKNPRTTWRDSYLSLTLYLEEKMDRSLSTLKSRFDEQKREDDRKKIKVLGNIRGNPCTNRSSRWQSQELLHGNPVRRMLKKRYKQVYGHLT